MPSRRAYEGTDVPVSKSQEDLRGLLLKFGADQFQIGEGRDWAGVEFVHSNHIVRLRCPIRPTTEADLRTRAAEQHVGIDKLRDGADEKERARIWRVMVWSVKARLVAVDEGVETFESAFLSHIVDPTTNRTVWEGVRERVENGALRNGGTGLLELERGD